jgi:hypothetical protein
MSFSANLAFELCLDLPVETAPEGIVMVSKCYRNSDRNDWLLMNLDSSLYRVTKTLIMRVSSLKMNLHSLS